MEVDLTSGSVGFGKKNSKYAESLFLTTIVTSGKVYSLHDYGPNFF